MKILKELSKSLKATNINSKDKNILQSITPPLPKKNHKIMCSLAKIIIKQSKTPISNNSRKSYVSLSQFFFTNSEPSNSV